MKAQKLVPKGLPDGTPPPVKDGPYRTRWKVALAKGLWRIDWGRSHPGVSCFHSSMGQDDDGTDRDIDANGWYSNAARCLDA